MARLSIKIHGHGTVLFVGKSGEHKALSKVYFTVYFILRLKNNSVGQLDECGSLVNIKDGVLRIWIDIVNSMQEALAT